MKAKVIAWIYFLAGVGNLLAHLIGSSELELYTKPILMPLLIYYLYTGARGVVTLPIILSCAALIFSWVGDVALLYPDTEYSFTLGLGAFLIAQIFYIIAMKKAAFMPMKVSIKKIWPFLTYGVVFLGFILPNTGQLFIPVIFYAICLLWMMISAVLREGETSGDSFRLVCFGAALFVISDSFLAIDRFGYSLPYSAFFVMITYIPAQYLIVKGILRHPD